MTPSIDQVMETALTLTPSQRAQLVDQLIATLSPEDAAPLDDAWLAEIERRSDAFDTGTVETVSWAELRNRVRQRLDSHA
jgi:putative addiction module component (TIGR02574 family)